MFGKILKIEELSNKTVKVSTDKYIITFEVQPGGCRPNIGIRAVELALKEDKPLILDKIGNFINLSSARDTYDETFFINSKIIDYDVIDLECIMSDDSTMCYPIIFDLAWADAIHHNHELSYTPGSIKVTVETV